MLIKALRLRYSKYVEPGALHWSCVYLVDKEGRYSVTGSEWTGGSGVQTDYTKDENVLSKLALLKASPPNTNIMGVGFRSDYEGNDRHIEPFFYVVI